MKQLLVALKSARKIEILIIAAMLCILLVLCMGGENIKDGANDEEKRMQHILSQIEGSGRVSVMITHNDDGEYAGVVVASSGADDVRAMLELQRAVKALTGLELEAIEIVKSKGRGDYPWNIFPGS